MPSPKSIALWLTALLSVATIQAQTRMIPHVTRAGGGFTTLVLMENGSVSPVSYSLQPYNAEGTALALVTGIQAGMTTSTVAADELLPEGTSHFEIVAADGILFSVAYTSVGTGGSPAHVREISEQGTTWNLFAGDWTTVFDGLAVINTGDQETEVWVAQLDASGSILASQRLAKQLQPNAKALYVIGDPNTSNFTRQAGDRFQVYGTQSLAVTALRGNIPGADFLWVNDARVRGKSQTSRDELGIWAIEDGDLFDVMRALGYTVASDRMWQMEILRLFGQGRLSEVPFFASFGNTIAQDRFARIIGYSDEEYEQALEAMSPDAKNSVIAYVEGINRRIAELNADLSLKPMEAQALSYTIKPWVAKEVLASMVSLLRQFDPMFFGAGQTDNAAILEELQENYPETASTMFEDLRWLNDPDAITMIPSANLNKASLIAKTSPLPQLRSDIDFARVNREITGRLLERRELLEKLNANYKMGSYAWVVSGQHTDSGNPILFSGPQMGFSSPSLPVEGSIRGGGLEISGMTVPGIPGMIIGRTPHHTWSMQVGAAHTDDLYFEPLSVFDTPHRTEVIYGPGGTVLSEFPVHRGEHGPVISLTIPIAWKYAHWGMEFNTIDAFLRLARADSMDSFGSALEDIGVSQHFCYADKDGNIAYWMSGRDPVRPAGEYRFPQGSFVGVPVLEYDSSIYKPLPHDRNPERGFYAGWNNKPFAGKENSPFDSYQYYGAYHRAELVVNAVQELVDRGNVTFEEISDIAIKIGATHDTTSLRDTIPFQVSDTRGTGGGNPWPALREAFTAAVQANATPDRLAALQIVEDWDGYFIDGGPVHWVSGTDRSDGWMLMDAWVRSVMLKSFSDEVTLSVVGTGSTINTLIHAVGNTTLTTGYDWFTNLKDSTAPQTFQDIVVASLDESLALLGPRPWGVDKRGTIAYFNTVMSIFNGRLPQHETPFSSRATYAQCVEMGPDGPVRISSFFPLGTSGNLFVDPEKPSSPLDFIPDPNLLTMVPFFDNFQMRAFPLFH